MCNIISDPSMIGDLFELDSSVFDNGPFRWYALTNAFNADRRHKQPYLDAYKESIACLTNGLRKALQTTVEAMKRDVPNLVSFSESVVDQNPCERISSASNRFTVGDGSAGSPAVEVGLFSLVQNFVGHLTLTSLVGSEFLEHYPSILDDLRDFDNGFEYLTLGAPRWFPIPSIAKAHFARQRLKNGINAFHKALDGIAAGGEPGYPWTDMGDVSAVMKERNAVWRAHGLTPGVKGACDLNLLWKSVFNLEALGSSRLTCVQHEHKN